MAVVTAFPTVLSATKSHATILSKPPTTVNLLAQHVLLDEGSSTSTIYSIVNDRCEINVRAPVMLKTFLGS